MGNLTDAKEWIKFAQRDYDVAVTLNKVHRPLPAENICYSCQQSIEKSLKAILIYHTNKAPLTHDIELLQELCRNHTKELNHPRLKARGWIAAEAA